ncbi:MAG: c-type cytochrome domain-containing protein [Planctomycetaceae bacterium]
MTHRLLICFAAAFLLNCASAAEDKINYTDHVRPIFRDKCFSCHNTNKKSANLDLSSYNALMQGGASGEVISAGSADDSYLFMLITHESEPSMPPESDRIPDPMLETVRQWIDGGAPETSSSKVMLPKKPKIDLNVSISAGARPEGSPPVPDVLNLEPVVHSEATTAVSAIATSPWAPVVAISGQKQVILYDTRTLQIAGVLPFPEGQIRVLKFSRNGALLLAGGGRGASKGLAVIWDVRTGERLFQVGDELDEVLAADISADHEFVALGGPQKIVRVYDTATGQLAREVNKKHTDWIMSVEFSPDTVLLATADRAGGLHVWETFTGRNYATLLGHSAQVNAVSWRIDSNVLASASKDTSIKLWEMEGGGNIKSWNAHGGGTSAVEFCRDGRLVSCGRDKVTRLWDQNGKQLLAFEAFADLALRVTHCDETDRVIAGDWTGAILAWSAADGQRVGELTSNPPMLTARLATAEAALPAAIEAQSKARAAHEQATAQHKTEADKLAAAQAMLAAAQQAIVGLEQEKTTQEPVLAAAKTKLSTQQQELAALNSVLPILQQAADSAKAAAAALPGDEPLAQSATTLADSFKSRSESAATRQTEVDAGAKDVANRDAAFIQITTSLTQQQQAAAAADAAVNTSTAVLEPLQKTLTEAQQAAAAADAGVQTIAQEVERWKQYIALRDELKSLHEQRATKNVQQLAMLEAEAVVTEHRQQMAASLQMIQTHEQTVATQQKMIEELQARIAATTQQEQQQTDQVAKHTEAIPALESALQQAGTAIVLLPEDPAIKASVDSLTAAVAAKKDSLAALQLAISKSQESVKADGAAVAAAMEAGKTAQELAAAGQQTLAALQAAEPPLVAAVEAATTEFQAAETQHQRAIEVVESRRSQLRPAAAVTQTESGQ